jgi:hypothetical protein
MPPAPAEIARVKSSPGRNSLPAAPAPYIIGFSVKERRRQVRKTMIKRLTLNKESILRLDPSSLREVVGGVSRLCTNTDDCTDSCQLSCACSTTLC